MSRRGGRRGSGNGRRHRKSGYGHSNGLRGAVWGALGLVALAFLGGAFWFLGDLQEPPVQANLCPQSGPSSALVVVLDLTDPIKGSQLAQVRTWVFSEILAAAPGTFLAVGLVSPDQVKKGAHFALCKPRRGEAANALYENPAMIAKRYEAEFERPLIESFQEMMLLGEADSSPIMEGIQATLGGVPGFSAGALPLKIVLVTDLLQHSDVFSFYRGETWSGFAASPAYSRLSRNLAGARIDILRIPRPGARIRDPGSVDEFWVSYFDQQGATSVRSHPIGDL